MRDEKRIANASEILRRSEWSCTIRVFGDPSRPLVWPVDGRSGDNLIRDEGEPGGGVVAGDRVSPRQGR